MKLLILGLIVSIVGAGLYKTAANIPELIVYVIVGITGLALFGIGLYHIIFDKIIRR